MTNALSDLLATRDWLLTDGATGTTLFNMGLQAGDAPEMWNVDHPDRITALYQGAVDAGSDIFLTNTFGGTSARMKLHNAQDRVFELNKVGAEIGREVADKAAISDAMMEIMSISRRLRLEPYSSREPVS